MVGTKNRSTIEKERIAAEIAARTVADARINDKPLAKEVLDNFMQLFAGLAAHHQPWPSSQGKNPNEDESKFRYYASMAVSTADRLAPFQSPTFKSIELRTPPPAPRVPGDDAKVIDINDPKVVQRQYLALVKSSKKAVG